MQRDNVTGLACAKQVWHVPMVSVRQMSCHVMLKLPLTIHRTMVVNQRVTSLFGKRTPGLEWTLK